MSGKKIILIIVLVVVGLPVVSRVYRNLKPVPLTFDRIEQKLAASGLTVTPIEETGYGHIDGAVDGRQLTVNGIPVQIYLFDDTARRDIAYTNYQQDVGEAIANQMGITTMLGVESRPNPNPRIWPVKKKKYLFMAITDDQDGVQTVIQAIKGL